MQATLPEIVDSGLVECVKVSETDFGIVQSEYQITPDKRIINQSHVYQSVEALLVAQRLSDAYTFIHQVRVSKIAERVARDLGLSDFEIEGIRVAGLLHDIGKIALPAQILNKIGRLSPEEFSLIKTHPGKGEEILNFLEFPWPVQKIVRQHHERLDGSGYPDGISGNAQLPAAQIIAVADVAEAVLTSRPYRERLCLEDLHRILSDKAGAVFNSDVYSSLINLINDEDGVLVECLGEGSIFGNAGLVGKRSVTR